MAQEPTRDTALIDRIVDLDREQARREAELAATITEFIDLRRAESVDGGVGAGRARVLPGEFAADEVAALGWSTNRVRDRARTYRRLRSALPRTWALWRDGAIDGYQASKLVQAADRLTRPESVTALDDGFAERPGTQTSTQLGRWLSRTVARLEPDPALRRHRRAMSDRNDRPAPSRPSHRPSPRPSRRRPRFRFVAIGGCGRARPVPLGCRRHARRARRPVQHGARRVRTGDRVSTGHLVPSPADRPARSAARCQPARPLPVCRARICDRRARRHLHVADMHHAGHAVRPRPHHPLTTRTDCRRQPRQRLPSPSPRQNACGVRCTATRARRVRLDDANEPHLRTCGGATPVGRWPQPSVVDHHTPLTDLIDHVDDADPPTWESDVRAALAPGTGSEPLLRTEIEAIAAAG
jgi:hypothetical protein